MKVIEFEPGDGTRYLVGVEPLDRESAKAIGWADGVMFYFGPGSAARANVLGVRSVCPGDLINRLGFDNDNYMAAAGAVVFAELLDVEAWGGQVTNVTERWDMHLGPLGPWREQLAALKRAPLKLWRLSQTDRQGWDTYDSCVVAAATEEEAVSISPCAVRDDEGWVSSEWASSFDKVVAELVGTVEPGQEKWAGKVVVASFNAG